MAKVRRVLAGAAAAAVALALVSCHGTDATYTIGGDISGVTGTAVLKLNGGNDIAVGNGSFKFDKKLLTDETFNVQIIDASDRCTIANGAGTVGKSNVSNVEIACAAHVLQSPQTIIRTASMSGAPEHPPVTTGASGVGGLIVVSNGTQMAITGGITFTGLVPLPGGVNVHLAPSGNPTGDGAAIIALIPSADGTAAVVPPGTTLDAIFIGPLVRGEFYFNVATVNNAGGEIRGAIELQGGVAASNIAPLDKAQVVPPTASTASGLGMLLADPATGRLLISYITHNVANATAAAIHTSAGAGTSGASIIPFANLQANFDNAGANLANPRAGAQLSAQNLADFNASRLYFEVDSQAFPTGEIRGNIAPQ